jgi:hypothetical protein
MTTQRLYCSEFSESLHQENHKIQKKERDREGNQCFRMTCQEKLDLNFLYIFRCQTVYVLRLTP